MGLIIFFVLWPNSLWKTQLRRSIPNSIYFLQNSTRSVQNAPKMEPKGPNMEPTRAKMKTKGPNIDQKGAERGPKNIEKSMHEKRLAQGQLPPTRRVTKSRQFDRKGRPGDRFWRSFWSHFPLKMWSKINPEIDTEKTWKNMKIRCRNYVNNHGQIYEFATLELLVDYVESSVLRR